MSWDQVAEVGTDIDVLVALVASTIVEPAELARRIRHERETGASMPDALRGALRERPLPLGHERVDAVRVAWLGAGVRVSVLGDPAYPERLEASDRDDLPLLLARRGAQPTPGPAIAIVGSRRATPYGREVAAWIAESCGRAGVRVVSGGAMGIDAAAHDAAIATRGGTTVVLGCGHSVAYPRPHAVTGGLFDRILAGGGTLLSELLPGTSPQAHRVRARNRIVAGLVDAVVVVEGGERSGTLVTAGEAAEQGTTVMAVPGDVRAPGSVAPHRLLTEGAVLCSGPRDVLAQLSLERTQSTATDNDIELPDLDLPRAAAALLRDRWPRPVSLEHLAAAAGLPAGRLLASVTSARIAGTVVQTPDGLVLSRGPAPDR